LMEPMFLRVPPDSLQSLAIMGDTMVPQGYHYAQYLTRITFDPNKAHPSMVFRPIQPLTDPEGEVVAELLTNPAIGRITGETPVAPEGMREVPVAPVNQAPAAATVTPAPAFAPAREPEPEVPDLTSGLRGKPTAEPPAKKRLGRPLKALQPTNGHTVPEAAAVAQAAVPVPDAGQAEPTDDELDAEIALLIKK